MLDDFDFVRSLDVGCCPGELEAIRTAFLLPARNQKETVNTSVYLCIDNLTYSDGWSMGSRSMTDAS